MVGIRVADARDAHCLSALATQVFLDTYATSGITLALAREAEAQFSASAFAERLRLANRRTLLAERLGHLVGFAEVTFDAAHALVCSRAAAELARLYVQSPFLRQGVGRQLLKHVEALAAAEGASALWLTAWIGNERALAFYASQGYEELGSTEYSFEGQAFENRLFAKALRSIPPPETPHVTPGLTGKTGARGSDTVE
jgi:GNAT superfamily N-acetyltransferase